MIHLHANLSTVFKPTTICSKAPTLPTGTPFKYISRSLYPQHLVLLGYQIDYITLVITSNVRIPSTFVTTPRKRYPLSYDRQLICSLASRGIIRNTSETPIFATEDLAY